MATRQKVIAGNWKMNLTRSESVELATAIASIDHDANSTTLLVFPATAWIDPVAEAVSGTQLQVGGQNCHSEVKGAFTGEVSAVMLAEICSYAMAGHSERRHVFGEANEQVAAKARAILDAGLRLVLCVGETLEERQDGAAETVVNKQLTTGLSAVTDSEVERVIIAYEPVWAIGTGVSASPDDAQAMCKYVRERMSERVGSAGEAVPVLYGGSVTADNARDLLGQTDIDGGLVGGASLNVQSFRAIVEASQSV